MRFQNGTECRYSIRDNGFIVLEFFNGFSMQREFNNIENLKDYIRPRYWSISNNSNSFQTDLFFMGESDVSDYNILSIRAFSSAIQEYIRGFDEIPQR